MRIEPHGQLLHRPLRPAALPHEDLVSMVREVFLDQPVPVLQVHAVVLPDAEALLLPRADHVFGDETEQTPVVKPPLPGLHLLVVGAAVKPEREEAPERFFTEKENPAWGQDALHFQEDALDIHELAEHLEGHDQPHRTVAKRKVQGVTRDAHGSSRQAPASCKARP